MATFGTLVDNFDDNTIDTTLWPACVNASEVGGRARATCDTGYNGYRSARSYTLIESFMAVRIFPPAVNGATGDTYAESGLGNGVGGTNLGTFVEVLGNTITFFSRVGWSDPGWTSITYSSTDHAWVRVRESGGTVYWDTSPDGLVWTNRRTASTPSWVTTDACEAWLESHRADGTNNFAEFDNFNTIPSRPPIIRRPLSGLIVR